MCAQTQLPAAICLWKIHHGSKIRITWWEWQVLLSSCQHSSSKPGARMENVFPTGCKPGNARTFWTSEELSLFFNPWEERIPEIHSSRGGTGRFCILYVKTLKCSCFPEFPEAAALQKLSLGKKIFQISTVFSGRFVQLPLPNLLFSSHHPDLNYLYFPKKLLDPHI